MSSSISSSDRSGLRYSLGLDACLVDERRLLQKGPYRCGMGNYLTQSGLPARLGKVRLRLPFARKPHSEDRLAIVGSRFRGAAMKKSTLPLTSARPVSLIVTELAVLEPTPQGLVLKELAAGVSASDVVALTEAKLVILSAVPTMPLAQ